MLIGNSWKVEAEPMNIVLYKKKKGHRKETGKPFVDWITAGYFATMKGVLTELVNLGVKDSELKDLKDIVDRINTIHDTITSLTATKVAHVHSRG